MPKSANVIDLFIKNVKNAQLNAADELGLVRAEIAKLQTLEKSLKADVVANAAPLEGDMFTATPVFAERDTVDWKAVAEKLEPSYQLVAAHTRHTTSISVRVTAHKKS